MPAPSDLVHQTSTTTGTGALTLATVNGKRSFLTAFGTGGTDTFDYFISNRDAAEWESGTGHENAGTLVRDTVIASSNSNNAVNFSAGTKDITNDIPAANQARLDAANTWAAQQTFSAAINLTSGQIAFPASQAASAGANTLDDYEEGTWTPVLTFATPGNLSVAYTLQSGTYTKIGRYVFTQGEVLTSTFTHTTASGASQITGLPFTSGSVRTSGPARWGGVTKAGFTDVIMAGSTGSTVLAPFACGSGVTGDNVNAADMPTGGTVVFIFGYPYQV